MLHCYKVYKHTSPNGKVYIGITSRSIQERMKSGYGSNPHFTRAIKKYGWGNIHSEILYDCLTREEACRLEISLIEQYNSKNENYGYNISSGGESHTGCKFKHTDEAKRKISKNNAHYWKGKKKPNLSKEHKEKLITSRSMKVECVETGIIYDSIRNAIRLTGINHIDKCCRGIMKSSKGHHWRYAK